MSTHAELCSETARRLKAVTPGARSDPFFVARMALHLGNGAEDLSAHRKHLRKLNAAQSVAPSQIRANPLKKKGRKVNTTERHPKGNQQVTAEMPASEEVLP